jgi:hypothetical protein
MRNLTSRYPHKPHVRERAAAVFAPGTATALPQLPSPKKSRFKEVPRVSQRPGGSRIAGPPAARGASARSRRAGLPEILSARGRCREGTNGRLRRAARPALPTCGPRLSSRRPDAVFAAPPNQPTPAEAHAVCNNHPDWGSHAVGDQKITHGPRWRPVARMRWGHAPSARVHPRARSPDHRAYDWGRRQGRTDARTGPRPAARESDTGEPSPRLLASAQNRCRHDGAVRNGDARAERRSHAAG